MKIWIELDLRGQAPPMPLIQVLTSLPNLSAETGLIARTDRIPMLLLDELPRRGFRGETSPDGAGYVTRIEVV